MVVVVQLGVKDPPSYAGHDRFSKHAKSTDTTVLLKTSRGNRCQYEGWTRCRGEAHSEGGPPGGGDIPKQPSRMFCPRGNH